MKDRLLNILLLSFVLLLGLNLFLPSPDKAVAIVEPHFVLAKASVVIPNHPNLKLSNPTDQKITFDTCKDLEILVNLRKLSIDGGAQSFCKVLDVAPKTDAVIDLNPLRVLFEKPADIGFRAKIGDKDLTASLVVEERGLFRSFFATVFYAPILNLFVLLLSVFPGHSLGLAIIAITILVRIILLVPQHQMLVSSRRLQEIQPKIQALQTKYKGDQAKIGMELMALYKKEKVNPLGACLPLAIQMPILLVLYWVLTSIQDTSNHFYFYSFFQNFEVSSIQTQFLRLDLLGIGGVVGIALAVLVGVTQWLQIKLSQKGIVIKPRTEEDANSLMPDPALMGKFMLWGMPAMITVTTYFFPAGVGIYWFISTLFMLVQQQIANQVADRKKRKGEIVEVAPTEKVGKK